MLSDYRPLVETNKTVIRRYYEDLWNRWNVAVADEIISSEVVFRGSLGVKASGIEGFKKYVALVRTAFPDFENSVDDLIAEGDRVVARLTYRGTHLGTLMDLMEQLEAGPTPPPRLRAGRPDTGTG